MKKSIKIYCGIPALLIVSYIVIVIIPAVIDGKTIGLGTLIFQYGITFLAGIPINLTVFLARKFSKRYYPPKNSFGQWRMWVISAGVMGMAISILYLLHTVVWLSGTADMRFLLLTGPGVCLIGGTGIYLAQIAMKRLYKKLGKKEMVKWIICVAGTGFLCFLVLLVLGCLLRAPGDQTAAAPFFNIDITVVIPSFIVFFILGNVMYFVFRNEERKKKNRTSTHDRRMI